MAKRPNKAYGTDMTGGLIALRGMKDVRALVSAFALALFIQVLAAGLISGALAAPGTSNPICEVLIGGEEVGTGQQNHSAADHQSCCLSGCQTGCAFGGTAKSTTPIWAASDQYAPVVYFNGSARSRDHPYFGRAISRGPPSV